MEIRVKPWCKMLLSACSLSVLLMGLFVVAGVAQQTFKASPISPTPLGIPLASKPGDWIIHAWTGNDAPFLRMKADIQRRIALGQSPNAVLAQERENARQHPADFAAQFRWLYAATQAASDSGDIDYRAIEAVARQDPGNIRGVARIRFAAGVLQGPDGYHPDLVRVGKRLLTADPHDEWVRGHLIYDMANGAALSEAKLLAQNWVKQEPNSLVAHSVLAYVYQNLWAVSHHQRVYAEKAIAEQQAFLRLAPPNDPGRKVATYLIKGFQRRLSSE